MLRPQRLVSIVAVLSVAAALISACSKGRSSNSQTETRATAAGNAMMMIGGDAAHGKVVFTQNCASCHGTTGREGGVGPSLTSEKSRKNLSATIAWIKNPQPPMPKLYPGTLNDKDVADVAAFVQSL
jgi:mono/diheme cytochrome c family protein